MKIITVAYWFCCRFGCRLLYLEKNLLLFSDQQTVVKDTANCWLCVYKCQLNKNLLDTSASEGEILYFKTKTKPCNSITQT